MRTVYHEVYVKGKLHAYNLHRLLLSINLSQGSFDSLFCKTNGDKYFRVYFICKKTAWRNPASVSYIAIVGFVRLIVCFCCLSFFSHRKNSVLHRTI